MRKPLRVPLNLVGDDAELAERLRVHLENKHGRMPAVQVARLAYRALAKQEKVPLVCKEENVSL